MPDEKKPEYIDDEKTVTRPAPMPPPPAPAIDDDEEPTRVLDPKRKPAGGKPQR